MDISVIAEAFVVTVVGGMGSVPGAFLAALLIAELQAFGILIFPKLTLVLVFALRGAVKSEHVERIEVLALYWHFVDAVWIVVFTVVYIIGR